MQLMPYKNLTLTRNRRFKNNENVPSTKVATIYYRRNGAGDIVYVLRFDQGGLQEFSTEYEALHVISIHWKQQGYRITRSVRLR